jgi:hypothetical protein
MLEDIARLLTIQDRDQRIRAFQTELARIPVERAARDRQLAESAARLEQAKGRLREIEVEKKGLEVDAGARRTAIERYRTQQLQTRKNEEYSALQHEIEAAEKAILAIEDRELELMEEAESLAPKIREAEAGHADEKAKIQKALEAILAKVPNIEARIAELQQTRSAEAKDVDDDLLDRYERLFANKNGSALVPLEGDVCTGCHVRVTHQTAIEVKAAKSVVHCPNCGRMLFLPA